MPPPPLSISRTLPSSQIEIVPLIKQTLTPHSLHSPVTFTRCYYSTSTALLLPVYMSLPILGTLCKMSHTIFVFMYVVYFT